MRKSLFLLVLMDCLLRSQQPAMVKPSVSQLFAEDQKDRSHAMGMPDAQWQKVRARDAERRRILRQLLAAGPLENARAYKQAAFILQHGDAPDDYLLAHVLASTAVANGDPGARYIAAATLDRYLQSIHQPQIYGTQYDWKHPGPKPKDATQAPYNFGLVSDSLRAESCVVSLRQQLENVRALDAGKDMP